MVTQCSNSEGGGWLTISMAVDQEPFTDVRVRQAMRLIVDREAMVEQVSGRIRPCRQRPLRVRSTLRTSVTSCRSASRISKPPRSCLPRPAPATSRSICSLPTTPLVCPRWRSCSPSRPRAPASPSTPQVIDGGTYWGDEYLKRTFATDYWGTRSFLLQVAAGSLNDTAPFPDDHWPPEGSTFLADYNAAIAEVDEAKRKAITDKMQTELYEEGGLIIPFFQNLLDAYDTRVVGLVERANTLNLDHFGRGLKNLSFAE